MQGSPNNERSVRSRYDPRVRDSSIPQALLFFRRSALNKRSLRFPPGSLSPRYRGFKESARLLGHATPSARVFTRAYANVLLVGKESHART